MSTPATVEGRPPAAPSTRPTVSRPNGWWAMLLLIATEAALFAALIASYFYIRFKSVHWPQDGVPDPKWVVPLISTGLLVSTAFPLLVAERAVFRGRRVLLRLALLAALALGTAYFLLQLYQLRDDWRHFPPQTNAYSSLYFTLIGAHWVHVGAGLLLLGWVELRALLGHVGPERNVAVQVTVLYWYFLAALALAILATTLSPLL